jgi:2,3-bisphosphoglycerate-dependent phosphoglycerate mutase
MDCGMPGFFAESIWVMRWQFIFLVEYMMHMGYRFNKHTAWLLCLFLFVTAGTAAAKRQAETIIVLVRHAEKDTVGGDPALTQNGKIRAERFKELFEPMKPDLFYSSPTQRTVNTILPLAKAVGLKIEDYDPMHQDAFAKKLKNTEGKTIIVAGHSNTIPKLANLIVGADVYCDIPDSEFGRIWVITIKNGEAHVVIKTY